MALVLTIGGVDKTSILSVQTLRITDRLNERSEASFELSVSAGGYHPSPGDAASITQGGSTRFAGYIWDLEEVLSVEKLNEVAQTIRIRCVDQHLLADRRLAAETYDNQTAAAIVTDLITQYLAAEGVTAGTIQTGPTVTKAVFNYIPISQALDELAELADFYWRINFDKTLDFAARSTNLAPWSVTASSEIRNVTVRKHREAYRNRQYGRAGVDVTASRTDSFKGNGTDKAFPLNFPVDATPTITVNVVGKTVGIRGIDTGKDWYWQRGDQIISQDDGGAALTSSDTLAVTYVGQFPIRVVADDSVEIAARAAAESTSGIYEAVEEIPNINDSDAALEIVEAKLARYARLNGEIAFDTTTTGLLAGQLLSINIPAFSINTQYLIESVDFEDFLGTDTSYRFRVKALDGSAVGGWLQFWKKLAAQGKTYVIRDNEVLVKLKRLADGVTVADTLSYVAAAPESRVGTATIGYSEVS